MLYILYLLITFRYGPRAIPLFRGVHRLYKKQFPVRRNKCIRASVYKSLTMNMSISKGVDRHLEQNVNFNDQTADWVYRVPSHPDATFCAADAQDATLEEFFSRPVRIHTFDWVVETAAYEYIDPWSLFFQNKRVVNRINNYNLLRAKLHVKVVINGNGFYYGRMIVGYMPRPSEIVGSPLPRAGVKQDLIQLSQLPHIYLDPTTSQGGQLDLPFFCPNNAISIPEAEFSQMGVLIFEDLTELKHANNGASPITVTVFAWATEVSLSIPTSTSCGAIVAQMGDEYGTGPVSKPAFTIARAAGALAKIPAIAPYAKATQMAANATGSIASIFGYSRPTQENPSNTVKPEYVGVLANTNTPDNATKLTMDCKQEVTIDPRVVGLESADEMTILSLSQRESLLTSFWWTGAFSPDFPLYSKHVTPVSFGMYSSGLSEELHLTPCAFAANPFTYWRGTMKFRFQIVASAFHKGRIKVVYDPYLLAATSVGEYNVNYSYVCDLATERDFTLEFGWGQKKSWLPILDLPTARSYYPAGNIGALLTTPGPNIGANGLFSVIVVNELTSANEDVPLVWINVFVSTSDDFEVCVPTCTHMSGLSWSPGITTGGGTPSKIEPMPKFQPQMGEDADPVDTSTESSPTLPAATGAMAPNLDKRDHTLDVFFGDPIVSFRQCLKRYQFVRAWQPTYTGVDNYILWRYILPDIPPYHGNMPHSLDLAVGGTPDPVEWNYVKTTLLNYLLPAFAGRRGGIRWKYHLTGVLNAPSSLSITRLGEGLGYYESVAEATPWTDMQPSLVAEFNQLYFPHTWCATHVTDVRNNPVIEAELPYYNNGRFYPCRVTDVLGPGRLTTSYHQLTAKVNIGNGAEAEPLIASYVSVAEDFNLFFFCGVPPLHLVNEPNAWVVE